MNLGFSLMTPGQNLLTWSGHAQETPRPQKALRSRSQRKTLLILFFNSHGPIHSFFYDDDMVDSEVYIQSVREMREQLRRKHPQLWADKNFFLLQDNASPTPLLTLWPSSSLSTWLNGFGHTLSTALICHRVTTGRSPS